MSFDLLPTLTPWLVGFATVVALGLVTTITILGALTVPAVVRNRRARLARGESLRRYYGHRLVLHG